MSTRTEIKDRIAKKKAQLEKAYETYEKLLETTAEQYRFDSGEGSQSTKNRNIDELAQQIERLESDIDALERRLKGAGLTSITLKRRC